MWPSLSVLARTVSTIESRDSKQTHRAKHWPYRWSARATFRFILTSLYRKADMRLQIGLGVFSILCLCALVSKSSSWEVFEFKWAKNEKDEVTCATSPPNSTQNAVASHGLCINQCNLRCPSTCQAVNYWKTSRLCEMFDYEPCSYDVQPDCTSYQVGQHYTRAQGTFQDLEFQERQSGCWGQHPIPPFPCNTLPSSLPLPFFPYHSPSFLIPLPHSLPPLRSRAP